MVPKRTVWCPLGDGQSLRINRRVDVFVEERPMQTALIILNSGADRIMDQTHASMQKVADPGAIRPWPSSILDIDFGPSDENINVRYCETY